MRDLVVTLLFFFLVFYAMRRPFIGVAAWAWITFAYPAGWAWGYSTNFRMNFTVAVLTFIGYIFLKDKPNVKIDKVMFFIVLFWCLGFVSTLNSQSLLIEFVWGKFEEFTKVILFYFAIVLIVNKKIHLDTLIWSIVLSVSSYAAMESFKFIVSLGSHRVVGFSGHLLGDRNDLAVAINMALPLIIYLIGQTKHQLLKIALIGLVLLNVLAIVGSYSRGGFIGLIVLGGYFFIKSNRKLLMSLVLLLLLGSFLTYAPGKWSERMDTVSTASSIDSSFIGRIWAWKISVKIANDNVFGNGFLATQDPLAWHQYRNSVDDFGPIKTPPIPEKQTVKAAHSIYFQVLGDLGYMGLFIYIMILSTLFFKLRELDKHAHSLGVKWAESLAKMLSISVVGYGITGASVSMAYFDFLFAIIGMVYVMENRVLVVKKQCPKINDKSNTSIETKSDKYFE